MNAPVKMLLIFLDETDTWQKLPLYEAIVRRLKQLGVAGATVYFGAMGFGSHQKVHHKGLFGISDDRPAVICVVDEEAKLRSVVPEIRPMVKEGLMALMDAEILP